MPDQVSDILKAALFLLGGGGGIKLFQMIRDAWRGRKSRSERQREKSDKEDRAAIDITEQLRELARDAVKEVRTEIDVIRRDLADERGKTSRLTARVVQLEKVLHDNHLEVPAEVA